MAVAVPAAAAPGPAGPAAAAVVLQGLLLEGVVVRAPGPGDESSSRARAGTLEFATTQRYPPPLVTPLSAKQFFRSRFFFFVNWFSVQLLGALTARFGERRVLNVVLEEIPFADQVPFKNVLVARKTSLI